MLSIRRWFGGSSRGERLLIPPVGAGDSQRLLKLGGKIFYVGEGVAGSSFEALSRQRRTRVFDSGIAGVLDNLRESNYDRGEHVAVFF